MFQVNRRIRGSRRRTARLPLRSSSDRSEEVEMAADRLFGLATREGNRPTRTVRAREQR